MKNILKILFVFFACCAIITSCCGSYNSKQPKEIIYVPTSNTISINEIVLLKEQLRRTRDSLKIARSDTARFVMRDSTISAELFVAKYKLERIRYYNDIAKRGNNIKYLRGWIKRVLE